MRPLPDSHPVLRSRLLWHADAAAGRGGHTLLLCRRAFELTEPVAGRLWISASQRFTLFLVGERIGRGPSRSDPDRWCVRSYELDLAPGPHVLAAIVTHRGASAEGEALDGRVGAAAWN
jgi:hypothetical protein